MSLNGTKYKAWKAQREAEQLERLRRKRIEMEGRSKRAEFKLSEEKRIGKAKETIREASPLRRVGSGLAAYTSMPPSRRRAPQRSVPAYDPFAPPGTPTRRRTKKQKSARSTMIRVNGTTITVNKSKSHKRRKQKRDSLMEAAGL